MRNKQTEEAINILNEYIVESVSKPILNYIEELEKRDKAVLVHYDKEGNPIEYINKQVIRNEIEELENENFQITLEPNIAFDSQVIRNNIKIGVLKQILGEN